MPEILAQMSKKKILITWPLPEAAMARARATYDVIAHGDNPQITIDELLETAKSVDALLITLNEKCRKDVIDRIPDNIKCISTYSIGFDHIDLEACKARGIKVGNAPHGVTVATAEIAMLLLLGGGVVANNILPKNKGAGTGFLHVNFGWGLAVFAGVLVAYKSGGHLNPAVTLGLVAAARALALIHGRDYVLPTDVQAVAQDVMAHRLVLGFDAIADNISPVQVVERLIAMVPAPTPVWNDQQRQQARTEHHYEPGRVHP